MCLVHLTPICKTREDRFRVGQLGNVSSACLKHYLFSEGRLLLPFFTADPSLLPTPPSVKPTLLFPDRGSPGLFGPRTESDGLPSPGQSWATWQREFEQSYVRFRLRRLVLVAADPTSVPTPPSVEPTLLVPDRGSPGLFGPRTESPLSCES